MVLFLDDDNEVLWDTSVQNTLAIFGPHGSGKTVLARHLALSWAEAGGTVLVSYRSGVHYADMQHAVHGSRGRRNTPDPVVAYGREMDKDSRDHRLLVVLDDAQLLRSQDKAYLSSRGPSNVTWVVTGIGPHSGWEHAAHIGMGNVRQKLARPLFGWSEDSDVSVLTRQKGSAMVKNADGTLSRLVVPASARYAPYQERATYLSAKAPLPTPERRSWYAEVAR